MGDLPTDEVGVEQLGESGSQEERGSEEREEEEEEGKGEI